MVLSPPLCLPFRSITINSQPSPNIWDVSLIISDPQGTGTGYYDGTTLSVNQWIGTGSYGYAFRINSITSQSPSLVRCIVEDVDNWNLNQDPSGGIDGAGPIDGNIGFVFELGPNGLPTLTEVVVFPNVTWTDSLFGRFNSTSQQASGGNLYKSFFRSNFTTPNENDSLQLTHYGLKGLAYTPGESVLITTRLYDAVIYNGGSAFISGPTLYYGGDAFSDTQPVPINFLGAFLLIPDMLYYGGDYSYISPFTLYGGNYMQAGYPVTGGSAYYSNSSYYGGNSIMNGVGYYGGNALSAGGPILYGGNYTNQTIYYGGNSSTISGVSYYAGNAYPIQSHGFIVNAGTAATTYQSTQTYMVTSGTSGPNTNVVYAAGNANSAFGQLVTSGTSNSLYTNLNTSLEGIVSYYDEASGNIVLEQLTNIYGIFGGLVDYTINLTGKRGTSIFSNYSPPIQKIGRFGDTYIDRTTKDFYIKHGAWMLI